MIKTAGAIPAAFYYAKKRRMTYDETKQKSPIVAAELL